MESSLQKVDYPNCADRSSTGIFAELFLSLYFPLLILADGSEAVLEQRRKLLFINYE